MQTVSYMGNGQITEFHFNFPYYENTNIVVTKNNKPATEYYIVGNSAGLDANIPYVGGKVVFEHAPISTDNITISRTLPMSRIVDYQPTSKLNPTLLNQDLNYIMEILKDFQDMLGLFRTQYADITDNETAQVLLQKMNTMTQAMENMGDVASINSNITTLNARTNNLSDYVVASQMPTAQNEYTWYRKYKSGWVEQGGIKDTNCTVQTVVFPVPMQSSDYTVFVHPINASENPQIELAYNKNKTNTQMQVLKVWLNQTTPVLTGGAVSWTIQGKGA